MTSQNVNMMNYISENVAVAGQSGVIERRNFYQVFISLSLLFIPVLALYFFYNRNLLFFKILDSELRCNLNRKS